MCSPLTNHDILLINLCSIIVKCLRAQNITCPTFALDQILPKFVAWILSFPQRQVQATPSCSLTLPWCFFCSFISSSESFMFQALSSKWMLKLVVKVSPFVKYSIVLYRMIWENDYSLIFCASNGRLHAFFVKKLLDIQLPFPSIAHLCALVILFTYIKLSQPSKLLIFLDSKLERANSRVTEQSLNSWNFQGLRIKSSVVFSNSQVIVKLLFRSTVT